jgi:phosphatidylinositol 3-kinase
VEATNVVHCCFVQSKASALTQMVSSLNPEGNAYGNYREYKYYLSSSVDCEVMFFLSHLDIPSARIQSIPDTENVSSTLFLPPPLCQASDSTTDPRNSIMSEVFITAQVYADGLDVHPMRISTKIPSKITESTIYWNEWLTLPVKFRDLPRNAVIALTIWSVGEIPIAGTTFSIFSRTGVMKDGLQCLRLWPHVAADAALHTTTPSDYNEDKMSTDSNSQRRQIIDCFELDKKREKYERHEMPRNEWVDRITNRRIARIHKGSGAPGLKEGFPAYCHIQEDACLWIEMPYFGHTVVYEEAPYHVESIVPLTESTNLIACSDPDLNEENPAERKYRKLAREILRGSIDPNLKPNRDEKFAIEALLSSSNDSLKPDEKDLLWKFRYTLVENRKALVKFLLSVDWLDDAEVNECKTELLERWYVYKTQRRQRFSLCLYRCLL